jgi:hypothetical protein
MARYGKAADDERDGDQRATTAGNERASVRQHRRRGESDGDHSPPRSPARFVSVDPQSYGRQCGTPKRLRMVSHEADLWHMCGTPEPKYATTDENGQQRLRRSDGISTFARQASDRLLIRWSSVRARQGPPRLTCENVAQRGSPGRPREANVKQRPARRAPPGPAEHPDLSASRGVRTALW